MIDKLRLLAKEHADLEQKIQTPEVLRNPKEIARIGKRISELKPLVSMLAEYEKYSSAIAFLKEAGDDPEMKTMAEEEANEARAKMPQLEERMRAFLVPKDPDDDRSVIMEVRAGTGGEEAALFAAELLKMYLRYAESRGWKTQLLDTSHGDAGGIKNATARIEGGGAYGQLKFESGGPR